MEVIKKDCQFFEKNEINDYSLLVGVHTIDAKERPSVYASILDPNGVKVSSSAILTVRYLN